MSKVYFDAVIAYKSAMEQVGRMANRGFISPGEQVNIDTILRQKYGIYESWVDRGWDCRGFFVQGKAEDAGGLTPTKDDNEAMCKKDRQARP